MAVASSTDQCHQCKEYGHFNRDCPQQVRKSRPQRGKEKGKGKQGGGGNYQPKWCSEDNTTKHSDAECNKQKELRDICLLYTSPSPRDKRQSRMPSSA